MKKMQRNQHEHSQGQEQKAESPRQHEMSHLPPFQQPPTVENLTKACAPSFLRGCDWRRGREVVRVGQRAQEVGAEMDQRLNMVG